MGNGRARLIISRLTAVKRRGRGLFEMDGVDEALRLAGHCD